DRRGLAGTPGPPPWDPPYGRRLGRAQPPHRAGAGRAHAADSGPPVAVGARAARLRARLRPRVRRCGPRRARADDERAHDRPRPRQRRPLRRSVHALEAADDPQHVRRGGAGGAAGAGRLHGRRRRRRARRVGRLRDPVPVAAPPLLRAGVDAAGGLRARRVRDAAVAAAGAEGDGRDRADVHAPPPRRRRSAGGAGGGGVALPRRDGGAGDGVHAPRLRVLRRPERPARAAPPPRVDRLRPGLLRPRRPRRLLPVSGAPEPGPAALAAEGVTHRYGEHVALRDVTFAVAPGERFALLGPNGGGKTTLFRLAATLMRPSEGRVAVFGNDTAAAPDAVRHRLGVIFQQPALDRELTVRESLRAHAALVGVPRAE